MSEAFRSPSPLRALGPVSLLFEKIIRALAYPPRQESFFLCVSTAPARLGLSYENKSQVGKIALAISAFRTEVPDLCRSPIRSEGR